MLAAGEPLLKVKQLSHLAEIFWVIALTVLFVLIGVKGEQQFRNSACWEVREVLHKLNLEWDSFWGFATMQIDKFFCSSFSVKAIENWTAKSYNLLRSKGSVVINTWSSAFANSIQFEAVSAHKGHPLNVAVGLYVRRNV